MTRQEYEEYHEQWYTGKCMICGCTVKTTDPYRPPVCEACAEEDFEEEEYE